MAIMTNMKPKKTPPEYEQDNLANPASVLKAANRPPPAPPREIATAKPAPPMTVAGKPAAPAPQRPVVPQQATGMVPAPTPTKQSGLASIDVTGSSAQRRESAASQVAKNAPGATASGFGKSALNEALAAKQEAGGSGLERALRAKQQAESETRARENIRSGTYRDISGTDAPTPREEVGPVVESVQMPEEINPASREMLDTQMSVLIEKLLSGQGMDVNTSEEEDLIKQLMQDQIGQGLVEQRARMGRAGFGSSGALAAMESDVRRRVAQEATGQTLALRRAAEQEAIDNALRAIGVETGLRKEGRADVFDKVFLDALRSALEQQDTSTPIPEEDFFTQKANQLGRAAQKIGDFFNVFNIGREREEPAPNPETANQTRFR